MSVESIEDYLGAIYRLRQEATTPLPLSQLGEYFAFSPVSIHEMIQKLDRQGLVQYIPYRGVLLTAAGEAEAIALIQRHRIWERFLTDLLEFSWDEAHQLAEHLEHAAPQTVTERLAHLLGNPERCPHGGPIPPQPETPGGQSLSEIQPGAQVHVLRIKPEMPEALQFLQAEQIGPRAVLQVLAQSAAHTLVETQGRRVDLPATIAQTLWVIADC